MFLIYFNIHLFYYSLIHNIYLFTLLIYFTIQLISQWKRIYTLHETFDYAVRWNYIVVTKENYLKLYEYLINRYICFTCFSFSQPTETLRYIARYVFTLTPCLPHEQPSDITGIYIHRSRYPVQSVPSKSSPWCNFVRARSSTSPRLTDNSPRSIYRSESLLDRAGNSFHKNDDFSFRTKSGLPFASTGGAFIWLRPLIDVNLR